MRFGKPAFRLTDLSDAFTFGIKGGGVPIVPPYPPPSGYQWVFVTERNGNITERGGNLVTLQRAA